MIRTVRTIRIPRAFFDDHRERDLPTPTVRKTLRCHYDIRADDPALPELISDAQHYAEGGISTTDFPHLFGLVASARAIIGSRAITRSDISTNSLGDGIAANPSKRSAPTPKEGHHPTFTGSPFQLSR